MPSNYQERQQAKKERYTDLARRNAEKAAAQSKEGWDRLAQIPFGQPIHVGHYSERADRSYRAKATGLIDKSVETSKKAEYYENKAESVGTGGVSSDDPEAIKKLKEKIVRFEAERDRCKAIIKAMRLSAEIFANGISPRTAALALLNLTDREKHILQVCPWYGQRLSPTHAANIRATQKRIESLEQAQKEEAHPDVVGSGYTIHEDKDENRIQIFFDVIPTEEIRQELKRHGFRWSPTNRAWQAFLNDHGRFQAKRVSERLTQINLQV